VKWGARVLRVRSVSREEVWASAGVQGALVGGCGCEADWGVFVFVESEALFVVVLPRRENSNRHPLYLLSAVAIGPSEPGGWLLSSSILAARLR